MNVSEKAAEARRRNARKSTGPQSLEGKARVARNALSHGLSIPYGLIPGAHEAVETLACTLLQSLNIDEERWRMDRALWNAACEFAESQLDIDRIRNVREQRLMAEIVTQVVPSQKELRKAFAAANRMKEEDGIEYIMRFTQDRLVCSNPPRSEKYTLLSRRLAAIDRYESRALSRRKRAARALALLQPGR